VTRAEFAALLDRLAVGWAAGGSGAVAAEFVENVRYADPTRYRFESRSGLIPFFEPPPGGHSTTWHRVLFDEALGVGAVEYTYVGHHRYHGAAFVEVGDDGLIRAWREYQHLDDAHDFEAFVAGPGR